MDQPLTIRERVRRWRWFVRRVRAELRRTLAEAAVWNDLHPDETPLDVERERIALHLAGRIDADLRRRDFRAASARLAAMIAALQE